MNDWNVFSHMASEPSVIVPHQIWAVGLGEDKDELPINFDVDQLVQLNASNIASHSLVEKMGRSEEDLRNLIKQAAERNQTIYISMRKE